MATTEDAKGIDDFIWTKEEQVEVQQSCNLLIASDCIYDEQCTDALFAALRVLFSNGIRKTLLMVRPFNEMHVSKRTYTFSVAALVLMRYGRQMIASCCCFCASASPSRSDTTLTCPQCKWKQTGTAASSPMCKLGKVGGQAWRISTVCPRVLNPNKKVLEDH